MSEKGQRVYQVIVWIVLVGLILWAILSGTGVTGSREEAKEPEEDSAESETVLADAEEIPESEAETETDTDADTDTDAAAVEEEVTHTVQADTIASYGIVLQEAKSLWVYGGHTYYLYDGVCSSWEEAEVYCEDMGGHLAVISSAGEDSFLFELMQQYGYSSAYFGLSREDDDEWLWVDGTAPDYTNWGDGEPSSTSERYGMYYYLYGDGEWNDAVFGDESTAFLCEWDFVPEDAA